MPNVTFYMSKQDHAAVCAVATKQGVGVGRLAADLLLERVLMDPSVKQSPPYATWDALDSHNSAIRREAQALSERMSYLEEELAELVAGKAPGKISGK